MHRPGATISEKHKISGIMSSIYRDFLYRAHHARHRDPNDAFGRSRDVKD